MWNNSLEIQVEGRDAVGKGGWREREMKATNRTKRSGLLGKVNSRMWRRTSLFRARLCVSRAAAFAESHTVTVLARRTEER